MKNIKIVNKQDYGATDIKYAIFATGYSSRHVYKVAKGLLKVLRDLDVEFQNMPKLFGMRDDDWQQLVVF